MWRRGPGRQAADAGGRDSARRRFRHPHPSVRQGRGRPASARLRAISTSSCTSSATGCSSARARRCSRACRSHSPPRRWADRSRFPGSMASAIAIEIPAGIQSGKQLRKRGAGMPVLQGRGRGDMVIEITVETPTQAVRAAEGIAARIAGDRDRRRMPAVEGLFRPHQGRLERSDRSRCADRQGVNHSAAARIVTLVHSLGIQPPSLLPASGAIASGQIARTLPHVIDQSWSASSRLLLRQGSPERPRAWNWRNSLRRTT